MPVFATTFLKTAIPFGLILGVVMWLADSSVTEATIWGIGGGVIIGLAMAWEKMRLVKEFAGKYVPEAGEKLLREVQSSHIQRGSLFFTPVSAGYLHLTSRRLHFKPRRAQTNAREVSLALADIVELTPYRAMGIYKNGLHVRTAQGEERFLVNIGGNQAWVDAIRAAKSTAHA
jgi:hypothetical protein